jgi:hypothetical protein
LPVKISRKVGCPASSINSSAAPFVLGAKCRAIFAAIIALAQSTASLANTEITLSPVTLKVIDAARTLR